MIDEPEDLETITRIGDVPIRIRTADWSVVSIGTCLTLSERCRILIRQNNAGDYIIKGFYSAGAAPFPDVEASAYLPHSTNQISTAMLSLQLELLRKVCRDESKAIPAACQQALDAMPPVELS